MCHSYGGCEKKGHMIPLSFDVMKIYEDAGFKLKELIVKEQHNCRATGYWKTNSIKYNFLLIAHEHLFILENLNILKGATLVYSSLSSYQ